MLHWAPSELRQKDSQNHCRRSDGATLAFYKNRTIFPSGKYDLNNQQSSGFGDVYHPFDGDFKLRERGEGLPTSQSSLRNSSFARPELYQSQITFLFIYYFQTSKNPDSESKFRGEGRGPAVRAWLSFLFCKTYFQGTRWVGDKHQGAILCYIKFKHDQSHYSTF